MGLKTLCAGTASPRGPRHNQTQVTLWQAPGTQQTRIEKRSSSFGASVGLQLTAVVFAVFACGFLSLSSSFNLPAFLRQSDRLPNLIQLRQSFRLELDLQTFHVLVGTYMALGLNDGITSSHQQCVSPNILQTEQSDTKQIHTTAWFYSRRRSRESSSFFHSLQTIVVNVDITALPHFQCILLERFVLSMVKLQPMRSEYVQ